MISMMPDSVVPSARRDNFIRIVGDTQLGAYSFVSFTNGWAVYNRSGKEQKIRLPKQASAVASGITGVQHTLSDLDGEIYLK